MKKRAALFFTSSLIFLFVGNYIFFDSAQPSSREEVVIERAIDGDTVKLEDGRTVRLININTPEKREKWHLEATAFLQQFENASVQLEPRGTEKYGRLLGAVYSGNDYINLELVRRGLAHSFLVSDDDLREFAQAQDEAEQAERGIWKRSEHYECLSAEIDKKGEYVSFRSVCASAIKGWSIKDETTHAYIIKRAPERDFTLYSGEGMETENSFYWNRGNAWNDDRDTLFVRDEQERLVLYIRYGY